MEHLKMAWSSQVLVTDATEWGLGVVECQWPEGSVTAVKRVWERWRFCDEDASYARMHAQQVAASFASTLGSNGSI